MPFTAAAIETLRANRAIPSPISPMPGKVTNKVLQSQGWNAKQAGFDLADCPYYDTSTAGQQWARGFRAA